HPRPAAETAHGVPKLRVNERVDHNRCMTAGTAHGTVEVIDRFRPGMTHFLELLFRKLGLERLDEPRGGLPGGVGDDVELDRLGHRPEASGWNAPCLRAPLQKGLTCF